MYQILILSNGKCSTIYPGFHGASKGNAQIKLGERRVVRFQAADAH